jgi:hypothetical protein
MTLGKTYDPLRAAQLDAQLESAMVCLSQVGPYLVNAQLSPWLRAAVVSLLESVEDFLPAGSPFQGIKDDKGQPQMPSVLAKKAQHCWELAFPLGLGRAVLKIFLESGKRPIGFTAEHK